MFVLSSVQNHKESPLLLPQVLCFKIRTGAEKSNSFLCGEKDRNTQRYGKEREKVSWQEVREGRKTASFSGFMQHLEHFGRKIIDATICIAVIHMTNIFSTV